MTGTDPATVPRPALTTGQAAKERAILALLAGDDRAAIITYLRGCHPSHVQAIATGSGYIGTMPAARPDRMVPVEEITVSDTARDTAARHLELLDSGAAAIRGVLAYFGYTYSGTGGWHITAYATPDRRLGFVNICHGVAMLTGYTLAAEMIEALTVPGQGDGPQVSAAVAWAGADAGEAHRASAPDGWLQLLADLRTDVGAVTLPGEIVTARIVTWCLDTCYDRYHDPEGRRGPRPGEPGLTALDPPLDADPMDPREWPARPETRQAMHEAGLAALGTIAREMAARAGLTEVTAALEDTTRTPAERLTAAAAAVWPGRSRLLTGMNQRTAAEQALRDAMGVMRESGAVAQALAGAEITQLTRESGDMSNPPGRHADLIDALLRRILLDRLLPATELLAAQIDGRRGTGIQGELAVSFTSLPAALVPLMLAAAERVLADAVVVAHTARKAMTGLYQAQGPVTVDIPVFRPAG